MLTNLRHVLIRACPDNNGLISDLAVTRCGQWFDNAQYLVHSMQHFVFNTIVQCISYVYLVYFVVVYLRANGNKVLEKAIILFSKANIASTLFHPDIFEAKEHSPFVLVQQPDQPGLVGDELLDHPFPGT